MRHSKMLGRHDKLSRVEQPHIGLGCVKVDPSTDQCRHEGDQPVCLAEKRTPVLFKFFSFRFCCNSQCHTK